MRTLDNNWPLSYAIKPWELYIGFNIKKYISILDQFLCVRDAYSFCGRVFRYFFMLALRDIVENLTFLKFPPGVRAQIEMVAYSGEDFKKARLNGAFKDIDFLASGFTGYQLILKFGNRYGKWEKRLYVSSGYRDRITKYTNEGKLLTSGKPRLVRDYVNEILKEFPIISKSEINKICTFGLKRYAYVNRSHCDVSLQNRLNDVVTTFCGRLYLDDERFWRNWHVKYRMRERVLYHLYRNQWDGYYYIGLTNEEHAEILAQKGKNKKFGEVALVKCKKELDHERWCFHVWRVPYPIDCGWKFYRDLVTNKAEYVGKNNYAKLHKYFRRRAGDGPAPADKQKLSTV